MNTHRILPALAAVLLVGACADFSSAFKVGGSQNAANELRPVADPFQQALVQGYTRNADSEYYQGNYRTADRYYRKASAVAAGKDVDIENTAFWTTAHGDRSKGLYGSDLQLANSTRANLAPWIEATKHNDPQAAAMQQLKFDCWIEQMSEQQYSQAALCQPTLQVAAAAPAPAPAPVQPAATAIESCEQNPDGYNRFGTLCKVSVINFGFDRYDLLKFGQYEVGGQTAAEQKASLDQIMRQVNSIKPARIDVMGRADSSGPDEYNYGLSDCRAQSVVAELRSQGLPANVETQIIPLGETDLIVPTGDNVREEKNRVVMVAYQTDRNAPAASRAQAKPARDTFGCGTTARHPSPLKSSTTVSNN